MEAIVINVNGSLEELECSRKDLMKKFRIHSRDLRSVFVRKQSTTVSRRGDCIIFNYGSVKLVIGSKEVFVFGLDKTKITETFIPFLTEKIQTHKEEIYFEHLIIDTTFAYILEKVARRFDDIERTSVQILEKLGTELRDEVLEQLLHLKKRLSKLGTNVKELQDVVDELFEEDEEIAELYLTKKPPKDMENVESILENALEQIEDLAHKIDELNENIDDSQEILTLKMDHMRTTVGKIDLLSNASAAMLTLLAVFTGLYGMNIRNGLEQNSVAFMTITVLTGMVFLFGLISLLLWLRRHKIL